MATILYIDHDETSRKNIQALLGGHHNVVSAGDGSTAIQYCAMIQPDLIMMEITLPDVDGHKLIPRLKMFMPQTPILLITAPQPGNGRLQTVKNSIDGLLTKPVDQAKLRQTIQGLLPQPVKFSHSVALPVQVIDQFENQIAALEQANKRLASLNAVSALIGTSLDVEHLTDEILNQIQRTINFDSATLLLLKSNILEAAASRGFLEYQRGMNVYHRSERNSAWQVVNNKLPLIINDVTASQYWEPRPELAQVRSWLGVPLIYKDRVVGVLTLDKNETNAFTDADARYLFTLAYQIAIAVENAQLFEEWESQATHLKLINEVAQEITTILNVNNLFDALARAIFERLSYDCVTIFEVGTPDVPAKLQARYSSASAQIDNAQQAVSANLINKVVKTGIPVLLNDTLQAEGAVSLYNKGVRAVMIMPIVVGNKIQAVISVENGRPNKFKDQDLWALSSLASQAATVIENARLYHDVDAYSDKLERVVAARTRRLQAIKKISQVVSQGLLVDDLLAVVSKQMSQVFTLENAENYQAKTAETNVAIGLVSGSRLSIKIIYRGADRPQENSDVANTESNRYKITPRLLAGQVIIQSKPLLANNANLHSVFSAHVKPKPDFENSLMLAPLITAGKTIGLVIVENPAPNAFDESDLETLETLAFQIASGIEHARLLQKTRELAVVNERTRLARDMHDGVAQNLAYLLIQVDRCITMVEEESKVEQQLEQIGSLLTQNIDELRRNIFDLRPLDLEEKSLFKALERFVTEFGRRWNLHTTCSVQENITNVSTEVERALYRIVQEALSNARQHAQCSQIAVTLTADDTWVVLQVADNGRGFASEQPAKNSATSKGLGLVSMRERAETVGGQLTVKSHKAEGTQVCAKLPL